MLHQIEKRLWSAVQSRLWNAFVCSRQGPATGHHNYLLWKNIWFYMNRWGIKLPSTDMVLSLGHENIRPVSFKKERQLHSSVSREALPWKLRFYQENEDQGMEHANSHSIMYVIYSRGNHPIISQLSCDWHCHEPQHALPGDKATGEIFWFELLVLLETSHKAWAFNTHVLIWRSQISTLLSFAAAKI